MVARSLAAVLAALMAPVPALAYEAIQAPVYPDPALTMPPPSGGVYWYGQPVAMPAPQPVPLHILPPAPCCYGDWPGPVLGYLQPEPVMAKVKVRRERPVTRASYETVRETISINGQPYVQLRQVPRMVTETVTELVTEDIPGMAYSLPDSYRDDSRVGGPVSGIQPLLRGDGMPVQGLLHAVRKGDTLSALARRYYGDAARWRELFGANFPTMPNPDTLSVGQVLVIPM